MKSKLLSKDVLTYNDCLKLEIFDLEVHLGDDEAILKDLLKSE